MKLDFISRINGFMQTYSFNQESSTQVLPCLSPLPPEVIGDKSGNFIERFSFILAGSYHQPLNHIDVAKSLSMSHRHLHRKLRVAFGMNFSQILCRFRLNKALALFEQELQIAQICEKVGFSSSSYFTKCFRREFGVSPKQYQLQLNAAIYPTELNLLSKAS
ncbi:helix-turn-helix transcriptional regulator [Shewanella sp. KX20019]|uniref:helix-turn-helix transcriptional regulator n=1 Tax=Shewanella sp. KX20019 TaxID=2803864 RepID=UPI0019267768|nr:helix-turn-helix transcriptional regulator [Shewanella sp. KX20019]QQX81256.1 helix-turn-helix transcriptional regulator [Shewanella sp. KX20019]